VLRIVLFALQLVYINRYAQFIFERLFDWIFYRRSYWSCGVLCIQESLRKGLTAGIMAGFGAALADALYGMIACIGLSLISPLLTQYQLWLQAIGSLLLWGLGIKIFKHEPKSVTTTQSGRSRKIFLSTFSLTLTNPLTLLCFAAIFTTVGITPGEEDLLTTLILSFGVLLGSIVWWTILSFATAVIGKRYSIHSSPLLNRISGLLFIGSGILSIVSPLSQAILYFS